MRNSEPLADVSLYLFYTFLFSCNNSKVPKTSLDPILSSTTAIQNKTKDIQVHPITKKTKLNIHLQSTGFLKARETSLIKSKTSAKITQLPIQEGSYIEKNNLITKQETDLLELQIQQLQIELQEAIFKKNELLIQQGGEMDMDTSVSEAQLKNILIRSGYHKITQAIKQKEYEISQAKIYAPFSGMVSDVKVKNHQLLSAGETICTLINPNTFEAEFFLLEKEALQIKMGQQAKVIPLAKPDLILAAEIIRINPVVNEQGLVKLYAKVKGKERLKLLEGMNVRVLIENSIPNQLVVPKEALVLRSGKEVIFTYDEKEKLAKWNYVKVAYENESQLAISEGLKVGDLVIVEGNNNLAHDAEVVLDVEEK